MKFSTNLIHGRLIKRYKRFLADILLDDNSVVTAHCTNSGSMKSCLEENAEVFLSPAENPARKTKFTWEMININNNWIGINTSVPNKIVPELIKNKCISELIGYDKITPEVTIEKSRLDLLVENRSADRCYIEIKNVTLKYDHFALFPDAVTTRGKKHLETLISLKDKGYRAVMVYIVQRMDVSVFAPAKKIDIAYAETLKKAYSKGVEIIPVQVSVSPQSIEFSRILPFELH